MLLVLAGIIQSGIREVVYLSDKYDKTPSNIASKKMFQMSGVKLRQLVLETKYPYVCHAELNAILNSTKNLNNCSIYFKPTGEEMSYIADQIADNKSETAEWQNVIKGIQKGQCVIS